MIMQAVGAGLVVEVAVNRVPAKKATRVGEIIFSRMLRATREFFEGDALVGLDPWY